MASILLTGGGTAGHCTPHLAILPYIKNDFNTINYVGSEKGIESNIIKEYNIPYYSIPCVKLDRSFNPKNLLIPFKLLKSISKAGNILDKLKPDVIFSKGGYVSLPTVIAAKKRKIPVIAHESDITPGIANRISSKYCKKILTTFPETAKEFSNGEFVGPPLRKSLFNSKKGDTIANFGFKNKKPILLVLGGSQGSNAINEIVRSSLTILLEKFNVIHICGKGKLNHDLKEKGYFQTEYMNKVENAYSVCDICVTRAGSNTLFELLALKIPCLIIPLPKGNSRGDQVLNANYFQKKGLAHVLQQNVLSVDSFILSVNALFESKQTLLDNINKHPIKDSSRIISRILADAIQ